MAQSQAATTEADQVLQLIQTINMARNVDDLLLKIKSKIETVCQAERVTIFSFDSLKKDLYTKVETDGDILEIRIPIDGSSIVGYAALKGQIVNIKDAYDANEFARYPGCSFDDKWDKQSGFKTKSVLAMPLRYREKLQDGSIRDTGLQGGIQLLNCKSGAAFNENDITLVKRVAMALAVAFFNQTKVKQKKSKFSYLLDKDLLSEEDLNKAIAQARSEKDPLKSDVPSLLVNSYGISKDEMGESLSQFFNTKYVPFDDSIMISSELLHGLNENFLRSKFFIPFSMEEGVITVLIDDPGDLHKIDEARAMLLARDLVFHVSLREDIISYMDLATGKKAKSVDLSELSETFDSAEMELDEGTTKKDEVQDMLNDDAPIIVRMVNKLIQEAYEQGISDIHIEPYPGVQPAQVRYRKDGTCFKYTEIPSNHIRAIVNRIKIMSKLKVDEKRFPQSGKIKLKYGQKDVELRVEVTPTVGGYEDVVMRILASGKPLPLDKMNFSAANEQNLKEIASKPYGLILCVGPTGSGKTTTLHSVLGYLNQPDRKIWTAEDPVEITQYGLRQVQVNPNIKPIPFDFALAMRSFLRADPDIIMVGEMRDRETANMGIEASLTGHLVLSTLHTNSAPETITRLIDMGLNPINFADALLGILAQRLVKTLCKDCKVGYQPSQEEFDLLANEYGIDDFPELGFASPADVTLYKHSEEGCEACGKTGYRGRTGVHELLLGSDEMKHLIMKSEPVEQLRKLAKEQGMRTLRSDGIMKVFKGQTDFAMVKSVCIE